MAYKSNKYFEFFEIDEGYYPEINESSIKDPKNKWQKTFPHKDIVKLLKITERALSRTNKKSIWLEGSYGTGKSRIIWMLRNLFSCSEEEFDAYFDGYTNLRNEIDLRARFLSLRRGKIVTAARYATGDITSTQKLIFAVFESLTAALKQNGYNFDGAKTLRGKIAGWLESDDANLEMFRAKIRKPEYRMSPSLAGRTAEEIIERLKNPESEVSQLVEEILELGEREGIVAFNINMKDLTEWITEVIEKNELKALILFWDEFSKFFANNRNNLDEFQRLAELTNIAPFYLFIASHQSQSLAGEGDQGFKSLHDRFEHMEISLPDNIALELIGHALQVKEVAKDNWNHISAALRERTERPRKVVMDFAKIDDEKILTDILPIHPMSAIILKNLAHYFASNQRSIFTFIKNSDPNVKAFQDFILTKSPEDGDLLTVDYLWNFFYESGTDENGGNVGRMNLKQSIREILDSYSFHKESLSADEQTVLKTVLLFQAIDRESGDGKVEIFKPTEENLELAFTGVAEMENGRAITIANDLVRKSILFRKPGKVETFAAMAIGGDAAEIERLKKEISKSLQTTELIESANLLEIISLTAAQKFRYVLNAVAAENFTRTINRLTDKISDYRIQVVVCFARDVDDQNEIQNLLNAAVRNERYRKLVFINASSNLISQEIFNRWLENSAYEKYLRAKDVDQANQFKNNAAECLKEWRKSFENGAFIYYHATASSEERRGISCQSADRITEKLKENVRQLYPFSFDDAPIVDTAFQGNALRRAAEAGVKHEEYSMLKANVIKIVLGEVWQMSGNYWEVVPDLSISRLKLELDALIEDKLAKDVRISFDEIFAHLLERGFMPLNIYAFLTGFLLKEYAADPYRFSAGLDGNQGGAMTAKKLAECVGESIAQALNPKKNYRPKYLEIMSQNQRQFMLFTSEIFKVTENISVERSVQKLRGKLKDLGCPFWCYVEAADESYKKFLRLLAGIANSKEVVAISPLAESAGNFLSSNPAAFRDLKNFLTAKKGNEIFSNFLKNFEGGIFFELGRELGMDDVVEQCRRRVTAGDAIWLRDKETAEDDLRKLIVDWKIVIASSKFINMEGKSFKACVKSWAIFCRFNLKIPADKFGESYPSLKDFFAILEEATEREDIPQSKREIFLSQLVEEADTIREALSEPQKILRQKYSYQFGDWSDEEIAVIYGRIPNDAFTYSEGRYRKNLDECVKRLSGERSKNKLTELWRKISGTKSPREWSKVHRTPILAMVPSNEQAAAKKVFGIIMAGSATENDVKFAVDYLERKPSYFSALKDEKQMEEAFREKVIGEPDVLFDDSDEVRNELELKLSADVYEWYPSPRAGELVKKFSESKYYSGGACEKLTAKVAQMSAEDAKKLLLELLDKNYEVGLKLLRET